MPRLRSVAQLDISLQQKRSCATKKAIKTDIIIKFYLMLSLKNLFVSSMLWNHGHGWSLPKIPQLSIHDLTHFMINQFMVSEGLVRSSKTFFLHTSVLFVPIPLLFQLYMGNVHQHSIIRFSISFITFIVSCNLRDFFVISRHIK